MNQTLSRAARGALLAAIVATAAAPQRFAPVLSTGVARADEPTWKDEFADVCSKTQDAMALSTEELEALVARAEKLVPEVEKLGEVERKVYTRRLRQCLELYKYVLESRKGAPKT